MLLFFPLLFLLTLIETYLFASRYGARNGRYPNLPAKILQHLQLILIRAIQLPKPPYKRLFELVPGLSFLFAVRLPSKEVN